MGDRGVRKEKETLGLSYEEGAVVNFLEMWLSEGRKRTFQSEGNLFSVTSEKVV